MTAPFAAAPAFAPSHPDSRLAADWLFLHAQVPPAKWPALPSFGAAASWLGMHASLRKGQGELEQLSRDYLAQRLDWRDYRQRLLQVAALHYSHLHGHHRNEDVHAFPRLRQLQPRLARGFELLDADHGHIEQQIRRIQDLLADLRQRPDNAPDAALAARLDDALRDGSRWLYLHLMDEEDLVIPVLALESEPWRANTASPLI